MSWPTVPCGRSRTARGRTGTSISGGAAATCGALILGAVCSRWHGRKNPREPSFPKRPPASPGAIHSRRYLLFSLIFGSASVGSESIASSVRLELVVGGSILSLARPVTNQKGALTVGVGSNRALPARPSSFVNDRRLDCCASGGTPPRSEVGMSR